MVVRLWAPRSTDWTHRLSHGGIRRHTRRVPWVRSKVLRGAPGQDSRTGQERGGGIACCCLTTRSSGPGKSVGRVFPRPGHCGRPLNEAVRQHSKSAMSSPNLTRGGMQSSKNHRGKCAGGQGSRLHRGCAWSALSQPSRLMGWLAFCGPCASIGAALGGGLKHRGLRNMLPNNSLERTVRQRAGWCGSCRSLISRSSWPAAQLGR